MKMRFKTKLVIFLIVSTTLPIMILGILSYTETQKVLLEVLKSENKRSVEHTNKYYLKNFLNTLEKSIEYWSQNKLLGTENLSNSQKNELEKQMSGFMKSNSDVLMIYFGSMKGDFIAFPEGGRVQKSYDPRARQWFQSAMILPGKVAWVAPYIDEITGKVTVSASMIVRNRETGKVTGVVGMSFTLERFSSAIAEISSNYGGAVIICNSNGIILNHPDKSYLGSDFSSKPWMKKILWNDIGELTVDMEMEKGKKSEKVFANYITIQETGWKVISLVPLDTVSNVTNPILDRTIILLVLGIAYAFLIGLKFSESVDKKIRKIVKYMEQVEKGVLDLGSYYDESDVFGVLSNKFNTMACSISNMMNEAKMLAKIDGLTKLYNHNTIFDKLAEEIRRAQRYNTKLSIMMLDVDNFKRINDTYGHQVGDKALEQISALLLKTMRETDIVGRYGGEEFLIVLPEIGQEDCYKAADRIRKSVEELEWEYRNTPLTVSIGIAELINEDTSAFVGKADALLYKAKRNGRNRVEQ